MVTCHANKTELLWERNVVFGWAGVCGEGWKMSSPKNICVGGYCNQDWWIYLYHPNYRLFFLGGGSGVGLNWVLLYVNENAKWSAELFRILNIILDLKIVFQTDIFQNVMLHASDKTRAFTYGNFGYKIKQVFIRSSYNNYYYLYKESLPENDQLKFKTLLGTYFLQLLDFQT